MRCLKDVNDGCALRYVFLTLFATRLGNAFAKRSETVLDRLALQGTDDAQPNGAGDQAPQGEKQEQPRGLLDVNTQCRRYGTK